MRVKPTLSYLKFPINHARFVRFFFDVQDPRENIDSFSIFYIHFFHTFLWYIFEKKNLVKYNDNDEQSTEFNIIYLTVKGKLGYVCARAYL